MRAVCIATDSRHVRLVPVSGLPSAASALRGRATMPARRARRGSSLLELLVAMPLALLLGAVAVQLFVSQMQLGERVGGRARNLRELEHAVSALAFDIRAAAATDLESATDSSIVLLAPVLAGYICAAPSPTVIEVMTGAVSHPLRAAEHAAPRVGDRLSVLPADSTLTGLPVAELDSALQRANVVQVTRESGACSGSPLRAATGGVPYRITLAAPPGPSPSGAAPDVGMAVQLSRRIEWRNYRGSDGLYYLGRRDWDPGGWNTTQPAAGPLLANRDAGLRLTVRRRDGRKVPASHPDAAWLDVELRIPRPAGRRRTVPHDSLLASLALRGGR